MKRPFFLSLPVLVLSLAGCQWCMDLVFDNIGNDPVLAKNFIRRFYHLRKHASVPVTN